MSYETADPLRPPMASSSTTPSAAPPPPAVATVATTAAASTTPNPPAQAPTAAAPASSASFDPTETTPDFNDYEESLPPWERDGWVPKSKSGNQLTPNMIRNKLQKHINECKANGTCSQQAIIDRLGVNNNSFRRFMNPATYKGKWSAVENGTYWAAAKLLEEVKHENEQVKKAGTKRKATGELSSSSIASTQATKKSKNEAKLRALQLISRIIAVEGVSYQDGIYDTCPQLVKKTNEFLAYDGVTKADFLDALGGINANSLNRFLAGKQQDQCGNVAYRATYEFFERFRILEKQPKSKARLKNEKDHPDGFSLQKRRKGTWKFLF